MINIYVLLEWCITSSLLILAVIAIRILTKNKISPLLRYSLWLVVLVRLLIPFNPLESMFSVMNIAEPVIDSVTPIRSVIDIHKNTGPVLYFNSSGIMQYQALTASGRYFIYGLWIYGMFVASERIISNNRKFWHELRHTRQPLQDHTDPIRPRLYVMKDITSPCLFGIGQPSVYLTQDVLSDPQILQHSLAHERAHHRHGDHIWSLLRLVALILHWYNPLVWVACYLSKQDGELAADETAIRQLGEDQRIAYGQTLIKLVAQAVRPGALLSCSTTMVSGMFSSKRALRKRILSIARAHKTTRLAAGFTTMLVLIIAIGTFTGAQGSTWSDAPAPNSTTIYDNSRSKPPICEELRRKIAENYDSSGYTDVSSLFPSLVGYDESFFSDYFMYRLDDGSLVGAVKVRTGSNGDLCYPIIETLKDFSKKSGWTYYMGQTSYEMHFSLVPERSPHDTTLHEISNQV